MGRNRRSDRNEQQRIVPDISFNCSGTVTRWIVAGDRATMGSANNMPEVQIWRETSSGSGVYNKVHGMSLPERTEDPSQIYEFTATMDVQPGDILGLFEPFRSWLQLYYTDQFGPVNYYMDTGSAVTPPTGDFVINAADGTMNDMPQVTVEISKLPFARGYKQKWSSLTLLPTPPPPHTHTHTQTHTRMWVFPC